MFHNAYIHLSLLIIQLGTFIKKWLICSWKHKKYRCYPEVWKEVSKYWHCAKCRPCGEVFDLLDKDKIKTWRQKILHADLTKLAS